MQKVTIYTLAEELGVTPSSVSRAFNPNSKLSDSKRSKILNLAKEYDFTPNRMASRLSQKVKKVGILLYSSYTPFIEALENGINKAYENIKGYKIIYDLRKVDKREGSAEKCYDVLNEFVIAGYDGILVAGLNDIEHRDFLAEQYKQNHNIGYIHTFSDLPRLFVSTQDTVMAAEIAAEVLSCCLKFSIKKNIVLFTGNLNSQVHRLAQDAFIKAAKDYSLHILECIDMKDDPELLKQKTSYVFNKYKDKINGIFISSGRSYNLCKYVYDNALQSEIALVTVDVYNELNDFI